MTSTCCGPSAACTCPSPPLQVCSPLVTHDINLLPHAWLPHPSGLADPASCMAASLTWPHAWLPRSPGLMHGCLAHPASCMAASRTWPHAWLPRAPGLMHGCLAGPASCMAASPAWPRAPGLIHGYLAHLAPASATLAYRYRICSGYDICMPRVQYALGQHCAAATTAA